MKMQSIKGRTLLNSCRRPGKDWDIRGSADPAITGLAYDSRDVRPGNLFFALPGVHTQGTHFLGDALEKGATMIVCRPEFEDELDTLTRQKIKTALDKETLLMVCTTYPRQAMSPLSAAFFGHPADRLNIIGVTGTDGKSSTVSYIHQLLTLAGEKAGFLSTVAYQAGSTLQKNPFRQSTPEAPQVHQFLKEMADEGCTYAVVEATSHGLSPRNSRLADVSFQGAVFTNVTREHLEFHGTLEQYRRDKSELFRLAGSHPRGFGIINRNDPHAPLFREAAGTQSFCAGYGIGKPGEENAAQEALSLWAEEVEEGPQGIQCLLKTASGETLSLQLPLPGLFNLENGMAALLGASLLTRRPLKEFTALAPQLRGVSGRMELIKGSHEFTVLVDYAHTPGSFEKLLPNLRKQCRGRLILIFGSAGERDREKRPLQGALAHRYGDILILTDEDPRLEDSQTILEEIAAGCPERTRDENLFLINDRREALKKAVQMARPGDTLAALGKGHEGSIIHADGPRDWLESRVLREILTEEGYQVL